MSASAYATLSDIQTLGRTLTTDEQTRATALLPVVCASLRYEAQKVGKDLDDMITANSDIGTVAKSVTVDVVLRYLNTPTKAEPMSQVSESALGYSVSGTYLVPGGGLFIKRSELARLGLRRQVCKLVEMYSDDD